MSVNSCLILISHNVTDLDGDGIIEKSEFETTYREAEGVDKVYKEDFRIIDTDRNDKVTRLELMVRIVNACSQKFCACQDKMRREFL